MKRILRLALLLCFVAVVALQACAASETIPAPSGTTADSKAAPPTAADEPVQAAEPQPIDFEQQLKFAAKQHLEGNYPLATQMLVNLLKMNAPPQVQSAALLELAGVEQDDNQWIKAQQVFSQYLQRFPDDARVPDVLLRQGLLYRKMGVNGLAASKFYAVMTSALKLKTGDLEHYKKIVSQAQMEIANTYYLEGKYPEAAEFFTRILRSEAPGADPEQIQLKLIRSHSFAANSVDTIAAATMFVAHYTNSADMAEVRFLLASALKDSGRVHESMQQVLLLLQSQEVMSQKDPTTWVYWKQRAGNEIANQFYKEGDYFNALEIYRTLALVQKAASWQVPVWYQIGLVYEQLQQWQKAMDTYDLIATRQKEIAPADLSPTLSSLFEMAKWRKDYVIWLQKAMAANLALMSSATNDVTPHPTK